MNVEYLRYARSVARDGSFSAAARQCRVSQPALSKGIAQLEGGLGAKLFDRSTRGATPTSFGLQMLPLIAAAVNAIDALTDGARQATTEARQTIHLGVSPLIGSEVVARAFAACRELLPDQTLMLREANMIPLRDAVRGGELDLVIVPALFAIPGCQHQIVYREPVAVLQPPARHTTDRTDGPIELDALAGDPLILVPDQCGLTAFTVALFADSNIPLQRYPGEAASYQVLQEWTQLGLGTTLLPVSKLTDPEQARPLHYDGQPVQISYQAAWRTDHRSHRQLAALVNAIATADLAPQLRPHQPTAA